MQDGGERPETMSHKDAAMFPLIASCALFGLYIFFQVFHFAIIIIIGYCCCTLELNMWFRYSDFLKGVHQSFADRLLLLLGNSGSHSSPQVRKHETTNDDERSSDDIIIVHVWLLAPLFRNWSLPVFQTTSTIFSSLRKARMGRKRHLSTTNSHHMTSSVSPSLPSLESGTS